jgi:hypothetical protein
MEFLRFYADEAIRDWKPTTSTSAADFGHRILFLAQLSLETGEEKYMEHARRGADYAAAGLALENGLLIISGLYRYYDQSQGVDLLAQGFLALDHPRHPAVRRLFDVTK